MLTGSLASAFYSNPRATQDLDLVIEPSREQVDRFVAAAAGAGLYVSKEAAEQALESRGQFNVIDPESGWKADLIVRKDRSFSRVEFSRRAVATLFGVEIALTSIEDLIIAKLEWSELGDSELQRRDLAQLLESAGADLDLGYIDKWARELDLERAWKRVAGEGNA